MCNATTCCSGKQKLCAGTRSVPKLSIHFQENSFLGWINLYMKVSGECVPWTWGNHYRSTPSQPQSKVFIEVWWGFQKDKSPRIFFPYFTLYLKKPQLSRTHTNSHLPTHPLTRKGCQLWGCLHWMYRLPTTTLSKMFCSWSCFDSLSCVHSSTEIQEDGHC